MYNSASAIVGVLLLVASASADVCTEQVYESACSIGGNLTATSVTNNDTQINTTSCDVYVNKADFTVQPIVAFPGALPVSDCFPWQSFLA